MSGGNGIGGTDVAIDPCDIDAWICGADLGGTDGEREYRGRAAVTRGDAGGAGFCPLERLMKRLLVGCRRESRGKVFWVSSWVCFIGDVRGVVIVV